MGGGKELQKADLAVIAALYRCGKSNKEISEESGISSRSVQRWTKYFHETGSNEIPITKKHSGRPCSVPPRILRLVQREIEKNPRITSKELKKKNPKLLDDTQLLLSDHIECITELITNAENLLQNMKKYFQHNGLLLNEKKTQFIFIGSRQYISCLPDDIVIRFSGNTITPCKTVKNLGVYFDQYMSFNVHIDEMYRKIMGTLIYLNRVGNCFDNETRVVVVEALVLSLMNYCLNIWGTTNKTQINRVQKLQNFAAKVAFGGLRKYDHVSPAIKHLQWLTIDNKCTYDMCILVYKILNGICPNWLLHLPTVCEVRETRTRQSNNLFVKKCNTLAGSKMTTVQGPALWNMIPLNIRNTGSLSNFKKLLKAYLLNH
nr:MAG: hypothetical protein [Metapenaeus ensis nimavirus]